MTIIVETLITNLILNKQGFEAGSKEAKAAAQDIKQGFTQATAVLASVSAAAYVTARAIKEVYQQGREGAGLKNTIDSFDRLTASIGTTSEALLRDMKVATKETMSDMQAMTLASQLMSLGLAKNHDEVVRLTRVASALNMPINDLVLALTNMTTRRFDQLNVSVDGFKEKLKELEKQGYSTEDAFKLAFLAQAEEQIDRTGDAADRTIGTYKRFEAVIDDLTAKQKRNVAEGLEPTVAALTDLAKGFQNVADAQAQLDADMGEGRLGVADTLVRLTALWGEAEESVVDFGDEGKRAFLSVVRGANDAEKAAEALSDELKSLTKTVEEIAKADEDYAEDLEDLTKKKEDLARKYDELDPKAKDYLKDLEDLQRETAELAQEEADLTAQYERDSKKRIANMILEQLEVEGLTQAEYNMWLQYMVHNGMITQEQANRAQAERQVATEIASGITTVANADARYKQILDELNGKTVQVNIHTRYTESGRRPVAGGFTSVNDPYGAGLHPGGGGRASGGPVMAGQAYNVAEFYRPEVFVPNQDGRIVPKDEMGKSATPSVVMLSDASIEKLKYELRKSGR